MNRIAVLPPDIAQKIAAGEVIERPVSVVKELVENALDAGASEIAVELLEGGKRLIRVRDDGCGMGRRDAELAFVRHATSKIAAEEDLFAIATLGFRGEALASISAVSRLTLRTSDGSGGAATLVEREAGAATEVRDIAFPRGTEIEVRDLFFNLPARAKFLRGDRSELGLIVKYLTNVVLAYPGLRFSAGHGPRTVLSCPPVDGLRERIHQLYGKEALDRLIEVDHDEDGRRVYGFASRPPGGRPDRSHQALFVNARPVRDKVLATALNQAYAGFLERDLSPEAFLFVTVPFSEVDVNVHPAKSEVRFHDPQAVFQIVRRGVEKARLRAGGLKEMGGVGAAPSAGALRDLAPGPRFRTGGPQPSLGLVAAEGPADYAEPEVRLEAGTEGDLTAARTAGGQRVVGQYVNAYILVEDADALLVVDQHNAHERILFDRFAEIDRDRKWPVTMSLIPLLFELGPAQAVGLEAALPALEGSGFRVEPMGGRSFALREYPNIFKPDEALGIVLEAVGEDRDVPAAPRKDLLLATMACKAAVKAGQPLPREKMEFLVRELFRTSNPALCPHGRPVVVRVAKSQIEKGLRRPVV
jgi:DNA mismatch repair protein MutL